MKFTTKTGTRQANTLKKVVAMRDTKEMSWAAIAEALEVAPRTVRRLYDESKGEGAHFASRIPGKGGRTVADPSVLPQWVQAALATFYGAAQVAA